MSKNIVISFDDLRENNDNWEKFEELFKEFPVIKITFFVITGESKKDYFEKIKTKNTELIFHSWEHSGHWLNWTKEQSIEQLKKYQEFGFEKGFKAPAYKWKEAHIKACDELGFWICSSPTVPVKAKQYWYTYPCDIVKIYPDREYDEYYDHIQQMHFSVCLEKLKIFLKETKPIYKFISEKIIINTNKDYEQQNIAYYWK